MMRNFKALTLCISAMLALGAFAATGAQAANQITAGEYPATVEAETTSELVTSNGVRSMTCSLDFTGTLSGPTASIQLTPEYTPGCAGNGNTTVTMNATGCTYTLTPTEVTSTTGTLKMTIDCPAGVSGIDADIWATGKSHNEGKLCRLVKPPQANKSFGEYHVREAGGLKDLELTLNSAVLLVRRIEGTALNCGAAEKTNSTYSGNMTAKAFNGAGSQVSLWVD